MFRFVTEEIREIGVQLLGRQLKETMLYWETADQDLSLDDSTLERATIWERLPKVVFSTMLSSAHGNARLASGELLEEIERLRAEPGRVTSRSAARLWPPGPPRWVFDEYRVGLAESRTFSSGVVHLGHRGALVAS